MDKISQAPKWLLLSVISLFALGLGVLAYLFVLKKGPAEEDVPKTVEIDIPEAEVSPDRRTTTSIFKDTEKSGTADDYWNNLIGEKEVEKDDPFAEGLDGKAQSTSLKATGDYSEEEIYMIKHGYKTKAEVDREHAERKARIAEQEAEAQARRSNSNYGMDEPRLTRAQQESLYFARVERSFQLAQKYSAQATGTAEPEPEPEPEPERTVDLTSSTTTPGSLPSDFDGGGGIISSLDSPETMGRNADGSVKTTPVKATFLKNETLTSGQRVIIRLMQDLMLSDGTIIPANTHITGICKTGRRLKIDVTKLHYGGRMFSVDISIYDNDGTEGIYCPMAEDSKRKKRAAKDAATGAISSAGSILGTMMGGSPMLGALASRGISAATSSLNSDGTISVNVTAGYEFYVYENIDKKKN